MINRELHRKYPTRVRNRCKLCGRPRGYIGKFDMCRLHFRELQASGELGCLIAGRRGGGERAGDLALGILRVAPPAFAIALEKHAAEDEAGGQSPRQPAKAPPATASPQ